MITIDTQTNMAVITDAFKIVTDFEELYQSYLKAAKGKRLRDDVLKFTDGLEGNLIDIQNELLWKTYQVGTYRSFYVHEPKLRLVMAQQFRDRIVNWAIYRQLYPFYDKVFIEDSYACRINKGSHKAADRLQYWLCQVDRKPSKWYYLKLDISKYFYRVDHDILQNILKQRIKDSDLLWLLDTIINSDSRKFGLPAGMSPEECTADMWLYDVGMPIGNLSSQLFANIYLNEADQYIKHKLHARKFVRYMDDSIILSDSKDQLAEYWELIEDYLAQELHLDLNKKTIIAPCEKGIEFVGYRMWATHRILKKSTARRMIRHTKNLCSLYLQQAIDDDYLKRYLASINGTLCHCNGMGLHTKLYSIFDNAGIKVYDF